MLAGVITQHVVEPELVHLLRTQRYVSSRYKMLVNWIVIVTS